MEVALYASDHGILVLVPACMHPAQDAERRYGTLKRCGQGHLDEIADPDMRARIEADLDRSAYALVSLREAQALLGMRHPCFRTAGFHLRQPTLWTRLHRRRHNGAQL